MTKIAVVYYSMYGHIKALTDSIVKGIKEGAPDAQVEVFLVPETLPEEVLQKMHAGPKADLPTITPEALKEFDGVAMGIPTRYGRAPAQWSAFFDRTGGLWASGALRGKMATIYSTTASLGGGQETTALTTVPFLVHQGMIYVPFGYGEFGLQTSLEEASGGSAYGAGGIAGGDGSRAISSKEHAVAVSHGKYFAQTVDRFIKGSAKVAPAAVSTEGAAAKEAPSAEKTTAEPYDTEAQGQGAAAVGGVTGAAATQQAAEPAAQAGAATGAPKQEQQAAEKATSGAKQTEQKKSGGLFSMCCGGKSQEKNFS